jgi:hypothetical protein
MNAKWVTRAPPTITHPHQGHQAPKQGVVFSYVSLQDRIPAKYPF